jgi:hypothetical protein
MLRAKVPDSIIALANTPLKKDLHLDEHGNPINSYVNTKLTRNTQHSRSSMTLRKGLRHPQKSTPRIDQSKHVAEGTAKVNWQSLEKMKVNDLKGFLNEDFEPTDLIGYEEPEDKEYLSAFNLDPSRKSKQEKKVKRDNELMSYGVYRGVLPPLSKRSIPTFKTARQGQDPLPSISHSKIGANKSRNVGL